jgi:hypothetical protein
MLWFPAMRVWPVGRAINAIKADDTSFMDIMLWFTYPWLAILAVIVVHELGHLVAGWSAGLKFVIIRFGPIEITSPLRISFQPGRIRGASGWTSMFPATTKRVRDRLLVLLVGGPLANLLSSMALICLVQNRSAFLDWFAFLSMVIGLANLVPFQRLNLVSDGKRILMLLRGDGQGERWMAILQLAGELRNGAMAEDLNPELLVMATAIRDDSPDTVIAHLIAYSASWYTGSDPDTARLMETCFQYSPFAPAMVREALFADAGVFQARKRKRADLAQGWLADLPTKTQVPGLRERVEAAILEAQDNCQGALRKLDEVESAILTLPDRQQRSVSLKWLQRWRTELSDKLNTQFTVQGRATV